MNTSVALNLATAASTLWLGYTIPGMGAWGIVCAVLWSGSAVVSWDKSERKATR